MAEGLGHPGDSERSRSWVEQKRRGGSGPGESHGPRAGRETFLLRAAIDRKGTQDPKIREMV